MREKQEVLRIHFFIICKINTCASAISTEMKILLCMKSVEKQELPYPLIEYLRTGW